MESGALDNQLAIQLGQLESVYDLRTCVDPNSPTMDSIADADSDSNDEEIGNSGSSPCIVNGNATATTASSLVFRESSSATSDMPTFPAPNAPGTFVTHHCTGTSDSSSVLPETWSFATENEDTTSSCDTSLVDSRNDADSTIPKSLPAVQEEMSVENYAGPSCSATPQPTRSSKRCRKRPAPVSDSRHITCPTCGMSLKTEELASHVQTELHRLGKLNKSRKHSSVYSKGVSTSRPRHDDGDEEYLDSHTRYKSYLRIRTRRERRHRSKRKKPGPGDEQTRCPVCEETITGTEEELAEHVNDCLLQQEEQGEELDVEGEEEEGGFEEYTWAGQTRIRASSLLEGGLTASGFQVGSKADPDEDIDLDIDGDDSNLYGQAQYTEADLLPCNSEEPEEEKERKALRNAFLRGEGTKVSRSIPCDRQRWKSSHSQSEDKRIQKDCAENGVSDNAEVVASLKAKLQEQEKQLEKLDRPKCLICMEWYTKPLTSVQCWHVHCEECWLRTLGTKKLCPQCNTITSPSDLRRIYL